MAPPRPEGPTAGDGAATPGRAGTPPTRAPGSTTGDAPAPSPASPGPVTAEGDAPPVATAGPGPVDTPPAGSTTPPAVGGTTAPSPSAPGAPLGPDPGAVAGPATSPAAPVPGDEDTAGSPALQLRWSDGSAATAGGRFGGHVAADRTLLRPAVDALDEVARSLVGAVRDAQAAGTTAAGAPGVTLLAGDSAWTLRVADGVTGADVASGAPLLGISLGGTPAAGATSETSAGPGAPGAAAGPTGTPGAIPPTGTPTTPGGSDADTSPLEALEALEAQAAATATALGRRAGLVGAFDAAVTTASARIGRHVSEALGAIGEVPTSTLVPALHQANAAMASAGSAARQAVATGIPVLVGSSDPAVATAAGVVPVEGTGDGRVSEILAVDVRAVAGAPGVPAAGIPGLAGAGGDASTTGSPTDAGRTVVVVGGVETTSPTRVLTGVRPGIDVTVAAPGTATLAITPDPGPALGRVQTLVDAVGQVADAVGGALGATGEIPAGGPGAAGRPAPTDTSRGALASTWAAMTSAASSFAASFTAPAASASGGDTVAGVLGAVAAPLAAAVGEAFVDADGRPLIAGTSVHRSRVALDREAFAHEYVKDAVGVENTVASVARSVASTSEAASDPRVGALAIRIQAELAPQGEYTIDKSGAEQRLDSRRIDLDRRVEALQSLLERLEDQSGWLASHTA
ncbi:hypothetical protein [Mobilicoccus pelagius]|uniref:Uncharacterized protein n=1 Tax=Mobilicoccus pelagius NBRC 104925 TaxID=1089455 RepID=H5USB8_9MICO|nr:hypothetical protein [Mobilicoccus pelagius]GAB48626.1 hypothetical protein MOPEL_078_00150 [Mobilicoccus pelagius NBRC 104925]